MKGYLALAGYAIGLLGAAAASASGDYSCYPDWRMPGREGHCAETAMLSPGNDTRVNLLFLLRDRQGLGRMDVGRAKIEDYSYGRTFFSWRLLQRAAFADWREDEAEGASAGSRCQSLAGSAPAFIAAVAASRQVSPSERVLLGTARGRLAQTCNGETNAAAWPGGVSSASGRDFLAYLHGADAFYAGRWDEARGAFTRLAGARDPWIGETARYMVARTELNAAQAAAFGEYGNFDAAKVDRAALRRAGDGLAVYLKRYPAGLYAASAQGFVRRTLWLAGDAAGLAREYERMLGTTPGTKAEAGRLIQEIDNKLLMPSPGGVSDAPMLLATIDLMRMRPEEESVKPALPLAELEAQRRHFAGKTELFDYLLASHHFYVGRDPRKVLALIPDDARAKSYSAVAFSRQVLRGMALAELRDRNEAGFWRELIRGAEPYFQRPVIELALALNLERSGRLADVFAAGSPVGDSTIREILLAAAAPPALLRAQAGDKARPVHERDVALFALLHKQLTRGFYADFLRDSASVRSGANTDAGLWRFPLQEQVPLGLFVAGRWSEEAYVCPALGATVRTLARIPGDAKAKLCLGEFYRLNGFDGFQGDSGRGASERHSRNRGFELGSGPDQFPGQANQRDELYAQVIADPRAPAAEKAYALYRAVNCYAPVGSNSCSDREVGLEVRRGWFQQLKRDYPASPWAKQLRYYW